MFYFCFVPLACVPPTFLQGLCACKLATWGGVLSSCEDTQTSQRVSGGGRGWGRWGVDEREGGNVFWGVMVVNVCACGPGQQHFPGWQESLQQRDVVHRATSLLLVWKRKKSPVAPKNRRDSLPEERPSEWLKRVFIKKKRERKKRV